MPLTGPEALEFSRFPRKTGSGGGRVGRRRLEGPLGGSIAQRVGQGDAVAAGEGDVLVPEGA
jgi:hypothetical protein